MGRLNKVKFVNVYEVRRKFGGQEEGGWWYNEYTCVEVYPTREENAEKIVEYLENEHEERAYGDIYSVRGGVDVIVRIENEPKKSETRERPMYE